MILIAVIPPCLDCEDRKVLCHSTCNKYMKYRREVDDLNSKIRNHPSKINTVTVSMERSIRRRLNNQL